MSTDAFIINFPQDSLAPPGVVDGDNRTDTQGGTTSESSGPVSSPTDDPLDVRLLRAIEHMLSDGTAVLYRNTTGTTRLKATNQPSTAAVDAPLFHGSCTAWMAAVTWTHFRALITKSECDRVTYALLGRPASSTQAEPHDEDLVQDLHDDPVAVAILALLDQPDQWAGQWKGSMSELHDVLRDMLLKAELHVGSVRGFPGSPSILSRHLRLPKTIAILTAFGIKVEVRRSNGSQIVLCRPPKALTDGTNPASSTLTGAAHVPLPPSDGEDATDDTAADREYARQLLGMLKVRSASPPADRPEGGKNES